MCVHTFVCVCDLQHSFLPINFQNSLTESPLFLPFVILYLDEESEVMTNSWVFSSKNCIWILIGQEEKKGKFQLRNYYSLCMMLFIVIYIFLI